MSTDLATLTYPVAFMIERSQAAFRRELPELMKTHSREWVAYHGDQRIGFARTQFELYDLCFRRGLHDDEFVVRSIEPEMADDILTPVSQCFF